MAVSREGENLAMYALGPGVGHIELQSVLNACVDIFRGEHDCYTVTV